jgi:hypothetical protein
MAWRCIQIRSQWHGGANGYPIEASSTSFISSQGFAELHACYRPVSTMQLCSIEQVMQPLDDPDTRMIRLRSTNHQLNLLVTSKFIKDRHNSIGVS